MPHQTIDSDTSLIIGTDGLKHLKKEAPVSYYENEVTGTLTSGDFANGNIIRWDFFNSIANGALVESNLHMRVKNNGADDILLSTLASLIGKLVLYINNVEVMRINSSDNCGFMEMLKQIKDAKSELSLNRLKNRNQGRTATGGGSFHTSIAAGASVTLKLNLNELLNDLLLGIDSSKCSKVSLEITWRTDSSAADVTKFLRNNAGNNTNMYSSLQFTNCFIRNKYIIVPPQYIIKTPISKNMLMLEKQVVTMASGVEKIIKLDDVFSARKKASAVLVVVRQAITDYSSADAFKVASPFDMKYKIFIGGKEIKKRDEEQDALDSSQRWIHSEGGADFSIEDSDFGPYYPWFSQTVPLSNIYQKDNESEHIRGIQNSPQANYEIHLTVSPPGTMSPNVELYLLYSELLTLTGKEVKIFT